MKKGSDAIFNFANSVIIAGNFTIPEVSVFYNKALYRANRVFIKSSNSIDLFSSPQYPLLGYYDHNPNIFWENVRVVKNYSNTLHINTVSFQ